VVAARSRQVVALVWSMVPAALAVGFVIEGCKRW
jgi:hypothetical protein